METPRGSCRDVVEAPRDKKQLKQGSNQQPAAVGRAGDQNQRCPGVQPVHQSESLHVVRQAHGMGLPPHLVARSIQRRLRSRGITYRRLRELVSDLFRPRKPPSSQDHEVPMETDHLEEGLMLSEASAVRALQMGLPRELVLAKVRAKVLSSGAGYANANDLIMEVLGG